MRGIAAGGTAAVRLGVQTGVDTSVEADVAATLTAVAAELRAIRAVLERRSAGGGRDA